MGRNLAKVATGAQRGVAAAENKITGEGETPEWNPPRRNPATSPA